MRGIYKIENIVNGKVYIGQSLNFNRRFYLHLHYLRNDKHSNKYLQKAWNKYGEENFSISILENLDDVSDDLIHNILGEREVYWINFYDSTNRSKGYNIADGGNTTRLCGDNNGNYGKHRPSYVKAKISSTAKENYANGKRHNHTEGKPLPYETRKKISEAHKGKKLSKNHRENISKGVNKRNNSEEYKLFIENRKKDPNWKKRCAENGKKRRKYTDEFVANVRAEYDKTGDMKQVAEKFKLRYKLCVEMVNRNGHFCNR